MKERSNEEKIRATKVRRNEEKIRATKVTKQWRKAKRIEVAKKTMKQWRKEELATYYLIINKIYSKFYIDGTLAANKGEIEKKDIYCGTHSSVATQRSKENRDNWLLLRYAQQLRCSANKGDFNLSRILVAIRKCLK